MFLEHNFACSNKGTADVMSLPFNLSNACFEKTIPIQGLNDFGTFLFVLRAKKLSRSSHNSFHLICFLVFFFCVDAIQCNIRS